MVPSSALPELPPKRHLVALQVLLQELNQEVLCKEGALQVLLQVVEVLAVSIVRHSN